MIKELFALLYGVLNAVPVHRVWVVLNRFKILYQLIGDRCPTYAGKADYLTIIRNRHDTRYYGHLHPFFPDALLKSKEMAVIKE